MSFITYSLDSIAKVLNLPLEDGCRELVAAPFITVAAVRIGNRGGICSLVTASSLITFWWFVLCVSGALEQRKFSIFRVCLFTYFSSGEGWFLTSPNSVFVAQFCCTEPDTITQQSVLIILDPVQGISFSWVSWI